MIYTHTQLEATFLGLALGDAFGEPLEFVKDLRRLQTMEPDVTNLMWTDDTHMSLYLARALHDSLSQTEWKFDANNFGHAVGRQFVQWLQDPLTPSTAPGNTCIQGATNYQATKTWTTSGVRASDGCGAVMRIAPLPFFLQGEDLIRAAEIQAQITHAHPNALEASIAGTHLLRTALDHPLTAEDVESTLYLLAHDWGRGGDVSRSLQSVLDQLSYPEAPRDFTTIHPGDGGWRSGSALGIALSSILRHPVPLGETPWSGETFSKVISTAARHPGDSDSTAAIAGMFFGASHGLTHLPQPWVKGLQLTEKIYAALKVIPAKGIAS